MASVVPAMTSVVPATHRALTGGSTHVPIGHAGVRILGKGKRSKNQNASKGKYNAEFLCQRLSSS
jgi:hypothetical protein